MRILHIINNLGSGGAERLLSEIIPIMNSDPNYEIEVLLLTNKGNVFDSKLNLFSVKLETTGVDNIYSICNIFKIRRFILKNNYDVVHVHLFPSLYWVSMAVKTIFQKKVKLVYTEHSTHNNRRNKKFFKLIDRFVYSSFDKIISISQKTQDNLVSWIGNKKNKHIVINNGVNIERFKNSIAYKKNDLIKGIDNNSKLVCMVGRFSVSKDQATLVKAMKLIHSEVHLLLVGEGETIDKVQKLTSELQLENRIHFLGYRDDIERIMKTADIIVLSSLWEGFGLVAVEGMASGKPVVATNVEGLREVIGDADLLFERQNAEELAMKIDLLLRNSEIYKKKSDFLYQRCEIFDIKTMINEYIAVYNEI